MPSYHDNKRGIIALTTSCALFTVNDTITKVTALIYPLGEVLFARGVACLIIVGIAFGFTYRTLRIPGVLQKTVLLRAALDTVANVAFVIALTHLRIADLMAIVMMSPLILTMLLAFFFKEEVGWRRWSAIGVGVIGMLLLIKPTPATFNAWALVGLVSAVFSAMRDITTRRIDPATPTLVVSFISLCGVTLTGAGIGWAFGENWLSFTPGYGGLLVLAAMFLSGGSTLSVSAFRNVDVTVVAPFRYSLVIWSALAGYFVFGEISDRLSATGGLLIVTSGLYMLHRERVRHRDIASRSAIR